MSTIEPTPSATETAPPPPSVQQIAATMPNLAPPPAGYTNVNGQLYVAGCPVASNGVRFGAYLLDAILAGVTLVIGWFIWSLIVWGKGQTPAKSLLGLRCVRTDTQRAATWGQMALREIVGKGIIGSVTFGITTLVSCFMILGTSRQGIWDKIATTVVVSDPNKQLAS